MIYFCADDYGLSPSLNRRIEECMEKGVINKVSVFVNFEPIDFEKLLGATVSLHLNLVEGKCLSDPKKIPLLAREDGTFRHTFTGLLRLSLLHPKAFAAQVREEICTQVRYWKKILPDGVPFRMDSHQHTYMIPGIKRVAISVLNSEGIEADYLRIPAEPIRPFLSAPDLFLTYSLSGLVKQHLLNFFHLLNHTKLEKAHIPTALFFGILFSGKMDYERVCRILPKYEKLAEKRGQDIEVLLHPGYPDESEEELLKKHVVFTHFYLSQGRKTEFDCVIKLKKEGLTCLTSNTTK